MGTRINSIAFQGIDVLDIDLQVQISSGLPSFTIVGLPDKAVAESRERVRAALHSIGISLPPKRITINLAPADLLKEGSHFDLSVACGILSAMEILPQEELSNYIIMGELGLDGRIIPVAGVLPASIHANSCDKGLICPAQQGGEAAWSGLDDILAPNDIVSLINHFKGTQILPKPTAEQSISDKQFLDMYDIKGQESAKRAVEIAACGSHNLLMVGPPGAGKSMLAARVSGILPPLSPKEALETSMIHSISGMLKDGKIISDRPFRDPHHSASTPSLIGGGRRAIPGEISLAHNGVLFLDELPEFSRSALESLRQPIENGFVTVSRVNNHVTYPAKFQLICAMNPCKCGNLGSHDQECSRAPKCALEYQSKISGPLLDRIDMHIEVSAVNPWDLAKVSNGEKSSSIRERVASARAFQAKRYAHLEDKKIRTNSDLRGEFIDTYATPDNEGKNLLLNAAEKLKLSARAYHRTLKVARTIADIEESESITRSHIAEALSFRRINYNK